MTIIPERMPLAEFLVSGKVFGGSWFSDGGLWELGTELEELGAKDMEVELDENGTSTGVLYVELNKNIPIQMLVAITREGPNMTDEEYYDELETCPELDLYLTIDGLGAFVWRMNHDLSHGRIQGTEEELEGVKTDIKNVQEKLEKTVPYCKRFGVPFEMVEKENLVFGGTSKAACDEYWQWFRHWDGWKKDLTDDQWDEFTRLYKNDESIEHLLPKTAWDEDSEKST